MREGSLITSLNIFKTVCWRWLLFKETLIFQFGRRIFRGRRLINVNAFYFWPLRHNSVLISEWESLTPFAACKSSFESIAVGIKIWNNDNKIEHCDLVSQNYWLVVKCFSVIYVAFYNRVHDLKYMVNFIGIYFGWQRCFLLIGDQAKILQTIPCLHYQVTWKINSIRNQGRDDRRWNQRFTVARRGERAT